MNCSQKLISLIFGTTAQQTPCQGAQLWIALKSWYLWYSEQQRITRLSITRCCELLSKVDIFDIRNNFNGNAIVKGTVVNCSQKLISLIFGTTSTNTLIVAYVLWIALKSWYLWYSEQPFTLDATSLLCCELLSKVDIFDIRNNLSSARSPSVSCCELLSKVDIFDIRNNLGFEYLGNDLRCELLSKVDIFDIRNNHYLHRINVAAGCELLSKVDIFDIRNNPNTCITYFNCCCELLSKVDIFDIRNNLVDRRRRITKLWIALKSWYLWYSEQPIIDVVYEGDLLWIALKSWYLWYSEQPGYVYPDICQSFMVVFTIKKWSCSNKKSRRFHGIFLY